MNIKIETLEVAGIASALKALRLPHNGETRSNINLSINAARIPVEWTTQYHTNFTTLTGISVHNKDLELMQNLQKSGDDHAKVLRGIIVWAEIEAPVYWWVEMETYVVGHQRLCSNSTMHTEAKGLKGEELQKIKAEIPMGRMMKKIDYISYPTLRRIVSQRHNHRLPEWHQFIEWVNTLPLADELIFNGLCTNVTKCDKIM